MEGKQKERLPKQLLSDPRFPDFTTLEQFQKMVQIIDFFIAAYGVNPDQPITSQISSKIKIKLIRVINRSYW